MDKGNEILTAAARVLRKETLKIVLNDGRVTPHGVKILERWAERETFTLRELERNPEKLMAVLLNQQAWEHPTDHENIEWQLQNGLAYHEIRELGVVLQTRAD